MSGVPAVEPGLDILLHVVERLADFVLLDIDEELEKKIHILDNHFASTSVGLKPSVTGVGEADIEAGFVIPEVSQCILLSTLPILVMKNRTSKTGDLDSSTTGTILGPCCCGRSLRKVDSGRVVTIVQLHWTWEIIVWPPLLHGDNTGCENDENTPETFS